MSRETDVADNAWKWIRNEWTEEQLAKLDGFGHTSIPSDREHTLQDASDANEYIVEALEHFGYRIKDVDLNEVCADLDGRILEVGRLAFQRKQERNV